MNTSIEVYLGAPIDIESERRFLSKLCGDLEARGLDTLILANFLLPPQNPIYQIDFLVILKDLVCHIELKNLTAPVMGQVNGMWHLQLPDGSQKAQGNPYRQALNCKFAISDQMLRLTNRDPSLKAKDGSKFYKHFESVVCVDPDLMAGSKVPSDRRVGVLGYPALLEFLTRAKSNPGWTLEQWKCFAMEMGLIRQEELISTPNDSMKAAEGLVSAYGKRFLDCHGPNIEMLVPSTASVASKRVASIQIDELFLKGKHGQLIGPSGSGKSLHAEYCAVKSLDAGRIPIFVRAIEYAGKLSTLLDRGIAHLCPRTGAVFIEAARRAGRPLTLIIDGFNECPERLRERLIQDMHAAYLRWEIPIITTGQRELSFPPELRGDVYEFCELNKNERHEILRKYAGRDLPSDIDDLTKPFHSAYELSLAAMCLGELQSNPSRTGLFEAYLRRRCSDIVDPVLTKRLLSEVAYVMKNDLRSSLAIEQVWRIGETVLDDQKTPLTTLQNIISCGLVDVRQGQCTFRHELLQRYFEAVALVRGATDLPSLATTLRRPIHQDLIEFVLGMQTDEPAIRTCLMAAGSSASRLCGACIQGRFGDVARSVVLADAHDMLRHAKQDLSKFAVAVSTTQPNESYIAVEIEGAREWTEYELSLMHAVAKSLQCGLLFDEVVNLVGDTENCCVSQLEDKIGVDVVKKRSFRSSLFWQLFVMGVPGRSLPATAIIRSIDGLLVEGIQPSVRKRIGQLFENVEDLSTAQIYFLLTFVRGNALPEGCDVARLINYCWNAGSYHLRLKILDCVLYWRDGNVSDATTRAISDTLSNLRTTDPILRTQWFEMMLAYDLVEPPITKEQVERDIAEILTQPDDPEAQESAYHVVASVFESMFDDVVYKAIENLNASDHTKLFTMAALAVPAYSMSADFILGRLLEVDDPNTLPAFRRFVRELEGEAFCPQESDACFVLGHMGCAKYLDEPAELTDLSNDDRRAWQCYGEIIFWLSKPNLSDGQIVDRCGPIWQTLQSSLAFESIDPLRWLAHTMSNSPDGTSENTVQRLFSVFQNKVRKVLEFGMKHRENLTAIDKRFQRDASIRELTTFMIFTLGQVGNSDSVNVLLPLIEDRYHGQDAVEAIRHLRSGRHVQRISVMHRVP